MNAVIEVGLPVFAVVLAGWFGGRFGLFERAATKALNDFVYFVAFPALIFLTVARVPLARTLDGPLLAAYGGGMLGTFLLCFAVGAVTTRRRPSELVMIAHASILGNTGYMGLPLLLLAFGDDGLLPALLFTVVNGAVVVGLTIILVELDQDTVGPGVIARSVVLALARNPLLMATLAGLAVAIAGVAVPPPLVAFADLLGNATAACALFGMGLFLVGRPLTRGFVEVGWLSALKLIVQPVLTWWLAVHVMHLATVPAACVVIAAAMPTGSLAFVTALRYGVGVERVTATILASTIASVVTVSVLLAWLNVG